MDRTAGREAGNQMRFNNLCWFRIARPRRLRDKVSRSIARLCAAFVVGLCGCASAGGPAPPAAARTGLDATLWVETAVEYRALARQAYATAARSLARALADSSWSGALEQGEGYEGLPPAVILDVDETVLDNSPYQGRLLADGEAYADDSWAAWVRERAAGAVPGAIEFTRAAARAGVAVFYVTNRDAALESDTRANLARLGFPIDDEGNDVVLARGERPEWGSDKGSRRAMIARAYRVLLLVGDDLADFVTAAPDQGGRREVFERYAGRWGRAWIVLPNPMYGSWERALLEGGGGSDPVARKLERLETGRPPAERD